jgi:preprotein translocase subunit SecF
MRILTNVNIDWLRWRWHALILSWVIILSGAGLLITRGLPLGIDFSGGTLVVVRFEQPVATRAVLDALASIPGDKVVQQYGDAGGNEVLIRLPQSEQAEEGFGLGQAGAAIVPNLEAAGFGNFEVLSTEVVGPVIGQDLQRKGMYATALSLLGIMTYISFRFRWNVGVGALTASLHDVFITLSILSFAGYEMSLNVVAAILTLVGYGVNDQIVIFDRVRENLRAHRRQPMNVVINKSVNQTLPRTVLTAGTTGFAVLGLYLFGGPVLEPFAFTLLVGIVSSTYSTVFIASAIADWLNSWRPPQLTPARVDPGGTSRGMPPSN